MSNKERLDAHEIRIQRLEKLSHNLTGTPRQDDRSSISPEQAANHERDSTRGEKSFTAHIEPTPQKQSETDKPWYKTFQGWKLRLEILAIAAGIWYAWVTYNQWHDSNRNFRIDQRPWIKVELVPSDPGGSQQVSVSATVGNLLTIPVRVKNIGKTPAESITATFALQIAGKDDALFLPPDMNNPPHVEHPTHKIGLTHVNTGTIFPDQFHDWPISKVDNSKIGDSQPVPVTQAEVDLLRQGSAIVYIEGTVSYWDEFGTKHWTRSCTAIPKTNITQLACVDYNRADNNY